MSDFTFNGISAASMGLTIERHPTIPKPRKRITAIAVPGRSGDLHQWDGSYDNVVIRYQCWFKAENAALDITSAAHKISEWLYSAPASARLEDTYDSLVFRHATMIGPADIANILNRHGRVTLEFSCDPRAFLKSAENALSLTGNGFLENPTPFVTKPLIEVTGSISGTIKIGSRTLTLLFGSGGNNGELTFWCDCESMEAWEIVDGIEVSRNKFVSSQDFPIIEPGRNDVTLTGGVVTANIWTRAYTL